MLQTMKTPNQCGLFARFTRGTQLKLRPSHRRYGAHYRNTDQLPSQLISECLFKNVHFFFS